MAFNPLTYLRESKAEFGNVVWPTRAATIRMTVLVIAISVLVGIYITGIDAMFTSLVERFLR